MRIKICGITRYEDAKVAANLGVDALGFIFYPKSPRYVTPVNAAEIIKKLPPFISKVGVFVDEDAQNAFDIVRFAGIDTIQLHGNESPQYCEMFPIPVIKAFQVSEDFDVSALSKYNVTGHLLDTWDPERKGGSGKTFNWEIAAKACRHCDTVILSGGLSPLNIKDAIETVHPYAIDVNSGVEMSPGVKNVYKIREVISIARQNVISP